MSVVRRCSAGAVVAGVVLIGAPAWAQEADPCAPGPDGTVPEMCTSAPVLEAEPATPTVDVEPEDPCAGSRPVEPGDGQVIDGDQGVAVGEPAPGTASEPERVDPGTAAGEDGIVCAFAVPISAPVDTAAGGGAPEAAPVGQLPRTGPYDRLLALTAVGAGLVVVGTGAVAAGRRRSGQV